MALDATEVTTPQIPKEYERVFSTVKLGVIPGWSCEDDTTQRRTANGGPVGSKQNLIRLAADELR